METRRYVGLGDGGAEKVYNSQLVATAAWFSEPPLQGVVLQFIVDPWTELSGDSNLVSDGSGDHVRMARVGEVSRNNQKVRRDDMLCNRRKSAFRVSAVPSLVELSTQWQDGMVMSGFRF